MNILYILINVFISFEKFLFNWKSLKKSNLLLAIHSRNGTNSSILLQTYSQFSTNIFSKNHCARKSSYLKEKWISILKKTNSSWSIPEKNLQAWKEQTNRYGAAISFRLASFFSTSSFIVHEFQLITIFSY